MTPTESVARLEALRSEISLAKARLCEQYAAHLAAFPLTGTQKELIALHVASGGNLCCRRGREFLSARIDPVWTELLNAWAYETLSGCGTGKTRKADDAVHDMAALATVMENGVDPGWLRYYLTE